MVGPEIAAAPPYWGQVQQRGKEEWDHSPLPNPLLEGAGAIGTAMGSTALVRGAARPWVGGLIHQPLTTAAHKGLAGSRGAPQGDARSELALRGGQSLVRFTHRFRGRAKIDRLRMREGQDEGD